MFERSLYVEATGAFLCLGAPAIGDGPINAMLSERDWLALAAVAAVGEHVAFHAGGLRGRRWQIRSDRAEVWQPQSWPDVADAASLARAVSGVAACFSTGGLPNDGLAPIVLSPAGRSLPNTPLARIAGPRIADLSRWLEQRFAKSVAMSPPPLDLLGFGPGLTPSGDDLACGVLLALAALGQLGLRDELSQAILAQAPLATTPLSAQFLGAAAAGLGSAALHDFVAALVGAQLDALPSAIERLGRIGHTSGWDALAGAWLTVKAFVDAGLRATRSP